MPRLVLAVFLLASCLFGQGNTGNILGTVTWPPNTFDYTRMAYIHPGRGLWRRTLIDALLGATRGLKAPAAFLDQTLCTWNTDNGLSRT